MGRKNKKESRRNYNDYLKSEEWKQLRELAFKKYGKICSNCSTFEGIFCVHHLRYRNLHDVTLEDLMILCEDCHNEFHRLMANGKVSYKPNEASDVRRLKTIDALNNRTRNYRILSQKKQKKSKHPRKKQSSPKSKSKKIIPQFYSYNEQKKSKLVTDWANAINKQLQKSTGVF